MSRPLPLVIAFSGLAAAVVTAQEAALPPEYTTVPEPAAESARPAARRPLSAASEARKPMPAPVPVPSTTSAEDRRSSRRVAFGSRREAGEERTAVEEERPRSFWERLFGRRKPKATPAPETPAPVATPTPKPVVKRKPKTTNAPATAARQATPRPKAASAPVGESPAAIAEEPRAAAIARTTPTPRATPATKKTAKVSPVIPAPAPTPARKPPVAPAADADAEAQEKYRYEVAKEKALQDSEVLKLKDKADSAVSDDEARKAQRAYNKALFNKMRSLDGSIKDRADRIEAAILKRLDSAE